MLGIDPWIAVGLLLFSVATTLASNWLIARFRRPALSHATSPSAVAVTVAVNLVWIALLFVAGVIATRYIERIDNPLIGYLAFGLVALLGSVVRAALYRHAEAQYVAGPGLTRQAWLRCALHNVTYLLFPIFLYLVTALLLRWPADPVLFIPLCFGALLADLDAKNSAMGRLLPFVSRRLESRFGHLQEWHTIATAAFVGAITAPLIVVFSPQIWYMIPLGFLSHLTLDLLGPQGIMLFWPFTRTRYGILGGLIESPGSSAERRLAAALAGMTIVLLWVVDLGPPPPPHAVVPSYEQTLERYYALRGRNLVFADVEGTWQATGRRVTDRFEILNAAGQTLIMLDRYTGSVFTAGQGGDDDLYLNRVSLATGAAAHIKAVELTLQEQTLAESLSVVYQMQREPGLQHIYISGDIVLPTVQEIVSPTLQVDYAQTRLRKIRWHGAGHYSLNYLTASELIELANLSVDTADLVMVAAYISPPDGPTATPLPSPPPGAEDSP